ncbi:sensor histidine kinase [Lentzea sp. NBRC 102530]|uniref:sensor histidine kinase n=1 Tax=Lentzea sp. NBRC 102530 TaxID=3032201 RepID=UPI002554E0D5|nr:sensor histidine kinase [Lentzea sp. NBRC 102530]
MWIKRPLLTDSLLALVLIVLHPLVLRAADEPGLPPVLLGVAGILPLAVRRRAPRVVFTLVLIAATVLIARYGTVGGVGLALQVALYTVAVRETLRVTLSLTALVGVAEVTSVVAGVHEIQPVSLLFDLVIVVGAVVLGRVVRRSSERARQLELAVCELEAAREQLAEEAAMRERARIARELHDIVAHSLSVIAVRAGVGRAMADDPRLARDALEVVETTAKEALSEMRHLLGALRSSPLDTSLEPQPGLDQLEALTASMRDVGLAPVLVLSGETFPMTAGAELTVYRIVQEALTNTLRHSCGPDVTVELRYLAERLEVEVTNSSSTEAGTPGHGLVGMRERALVYGGSLDAERLADGRFRVKVTLPREKQEALR